jgi:hypothetical protein
MVRQTLALGMVGLILLLTVGIGQAAPPSLGPPPPRDPILDLPVQAILTAMVKGQVEKTLANVNAMAAQNSSVHAKVSYSFNVYGPSLFATQYTDRPNENFVKVPYIMDYRIYDIQKHTAVGWVGVPVERHISQSIDINVSCDKWQTGQGNVKVTAVIQAPYLDNSQGTLEEVVNFFLANTLTSYIDSQVRQQLSSVQTGSVVTNLPAKCDSLGAFQGQLSDLSDDTIQWSLHPKLVTAATAASVYGQMSVKLVSLKRLTAHDMHGGVLYKPSEAPALDFYANFQHFYVPLPALQEGQQIPLNAPVMSMDRPGDNEPLVLIGSMIQNVAIGTQPTDSSFLAFTKANNFGNGMQTLRIPKVYWSQFDPKTGAKPYPIYVDAYELTIQVNAPMPTMTQGIAGGTTTGPTTGPVTVSPGALAPIMKAPAVMRRGVEDEQPGAPAPGEPPQPQESPR